MVGPARTPSFDAEGQLWSPRYQDIYRGGGSPAADREEVGVFLAGNGLAERFARARGAFTIGETGFGTGLSFLCAAQLFVERAPAAARLHFVSVEAEPLTRTVLERVHHAHPGLAPLATELQAAWPDDGDFGGASFARIPLCRGRVVLFLLLGDVEARLPAHPFAADAWFLDGFAPARNPAMWSETTLGAVAAATVAGGTCATWSVAAAVRERLTAGGFEVSKQPGPMPSRKPGSTERRSILVGQKMSSREVAPTWWRPRIDATQRPVRVTVHGGGLAAASTARACADRGLEVTVIAPSDAPPGAADLPLGVLQPRLWSGDVPDAELVAEAFAWTRARLAASEVERAAAEWVGCGVLHPALTAEVSDRLRDRVAAVADRRWAGHPAAEWLDASEVVTRLGRRDAAGVFGGAWIPGGGCYRPAGWAQHLLAHPGIRRVSDPNAAKGADAEVFATGAGTGAGTGIGAGTDALPFDRVGGQLTLIEDPDAGPPHCVVSNHGHVTPAVGGVRALGSTYRTGDPSLATSEADDAHNLQRLAQTLPDLAARLRTQSHRSWTGVRAVTVDRLPYVGPIPDRAAFEAAFTDELLGRKRHGTTVDDSSVWTPRFAQFGHASRGLATAPFAGELVAAMLCGEVLPLREDLMRRLSPARALVRALRVRNPSA